MSSKTAVIVAIISGVFLLIAAVISGVFLILSNNTKQEISASATASAQVTSPPASPSSVISFQDFEKDNGTPGDYFRNAWYVTCDLSTSNVYQGERALHCRAQARAKGGPTDRGGTVAINPSQNRSVDLSDFNNLFVSVYDAQGGNTLQLVLWDRDGHRSTEVWSDMRTIKAQWTEISWNLKNFRNVEPSQIEYLEIYTPQDGDYTFDAVGAN
jgi:hypothetical protein